LENESRDMNLNLLDRSESLTAALASSLADVVQRVQRCLVVVHNGKRGAGAGVIWRQGGYIVTNHHVVAAMGSGWLPPWAPAWAGGRSRRAASTPQVNVSLADGRDLSARLVAQDPEIDIALLQVEADSLPTALVADSRSLRVGQIILAVGHPWGQRGVVTAGIISGLGSAQTNGPRQQVPIVRSDVVLAPGNSGGPMVNAVGGVVGINTMIVGGDLGVAIPSHLVNEFVLKAVGGADAGSASPNGSAEGVL
jgi:serine protease Do